ncbi:hypothetical protein SEVIR_5G219400v4 [Setaria viridis]|uniref:Uncharacterized protein n=3 Tax=Setaria TaxID=4554 RepID=A0A368R7B5_SETIT|nr:hypothetical protein SETIT_5G212700v2 [Setaria italica]TKW15177.1 hypothetical protein SEVIR_5G219400v2 [Setaria viridis]
MGIGTGTAALFAAAVVVVVAVPSSPAAGSAAAAEDQGGRLPCFHACFDQCVPRDEFWFCQFSCYHRCAGSYGAATVPGHLSCEQPCALSLCGQLRPGSKIMAACRDTCRKSYAVAACRSSARARVMTPLT